MKVNTRSKNTANANYKAFNVTLQEVSGKLKVIGAFGASTIETPEDKWTRLDSRGFARALKTAELVTK